MKELSENLNEQLMQIIDKDLPNQVGEKLKQVLSESKDNQEKIVELKKEIEDLEKKNLSWSKMNCEKESELNKWKKKKDRYLSLEEDKLTLEEERRNFKLKLMELELKLEKAHKLDYRSIIEVVFKSPVYKTEIDININRQIPVKDGSYASQTQTVYDNESKIVKLSEE